MEDVDSQIKERLNKVKISVLTKINNRTYKYLSDIINGRVNSPQDKTIDINEALLAPIFDKIDKEILTEYDKNKIKKVIKKI